jgi:CheY-like chemotaxis protein
MRVSPDARVSTRHRHAVLVVEDDDEARAALRQLLEINGYEVVSVADAEEAMRRLTDGALPCVILLDVELPGKTGWEFREEQLSQPALRHIPVVVFSGNANGRARAEGLGIRDYLTKPAEVTGFFDAIRRHCARE